MRTHRSIALWGILLASLLAFGASVSAQEIGLSGLSKEAQIIRAAYARLAELSTSTETPVRFALTDFRTILAEDFPSTDLFDALTLDGDLLQVERSTLTHARTGERRVEYIPSWVEEVEPFLESKAALDWRVSTMTVADLLAAKASEDDQSDLLAGHSLTTYQVTLNLAEKSRTYRAAFLWLSDPTGKSVDFHVLDRVTPRVDDAVVEYLPLVGDREKFTLSGLEDAVEAEIGALGTKSAPTNCIADSYNIPFPDSHESSTDHLFGKHSLSVTLGATCKCLGGTVPNCTSTCLGLIQGADCSGHGITISSNHCFRTSSDKTFDSSNSMLSGPSCGSAYVCGVKACLFCLCNFSVSVNWNGVKWNFSSENGLVDQFKSRPTNDTLDCLPCMDGPDTPEL